MKELSNVRPAVHRTVHPFFLNDNDDNNKTDSSRNSCCPHTNPHDQRTQDSNIGLDMKDQQSVAKGGSSKKKDKAPYKKKDKVPYKKEHSPSKHGRSEKNSKKGAKIAKIPPLTKAGQGEKKYSCLGHECEETFDAWNAATRHMQKCEEHQLLESKKPNMQLSRKKANDLLQEGKTSIE